MFYVYIIQSVSHSEQIYVGYTSHLNERMISHNAGKNKHTSKFTPWKILTYVAFSSEQKAIQFEQFLKSGSGNALLKKRLI